MSEQFLKEANEIINPLVKEERKKEAFGIFMVSFAMTGLMLGATENKKEVVEENAKMAASMLNDSGFETNKSKIEAALLISLFKISINKEDNSTAEKMDKTVYEIFEKMLWSKEIREKEAI